MNSKTSLAVNVMMLVVVFILLLCFGFRIASQKPLWNDEIYSQLSSVEQLSCKEILWGKVSEGNATPLFYLGQKFVCVVAGYHSPIEWRVGTAGWGFDRPVDRLVLRIVPVVTTALAGALIFYYFLNVYSLPTAFIALFLTLSSEMLLNYLAEARPYALWMFLTTLQTLIFLQLCKHDKRKKILVFLLSVVHVLLSMTVVLSLPQIMLVSILLWFYRVRRWQDVVFLLLLPAVIVFAYYGISPKYPFGLIFSVDQYLRANISRDRFYIAGLFALVLIVYGVEQKFRSKNFFGSGILDGLPAFILFCGSVVCACGLLALFKIRQAPVMQFPVTEKYFIFLVIVGIIVVTIFSDTLIRSTKPRWLQIAFLIGLAGFLIPRMIKVAALLFEKYPNLIF